MISKETHADTNDQDMNQEEDEEEKE